MYIFIDAAPGTDDFIALSYILSQTKHEIVGISSVAGNVNLEFTTRNLQLITGIFNKKFNRNVTIFKGNFEPIIQVDNMDACLTHEDDGLAGFWSSEYYKNHKDEVEEICNHCTISEVHAAFALSELSKEYEGELVIIALGPLGNIAMVDLIDPQFKSRVKEIFILGGDVMGQENRFGYPSLEFSHDPRSAFVVFKHMICKKTVLPLEIVRELYISKDIGRAWLKQLESRTDLLSVIKHMIIDVYVRNRKIFRWYDLVLGFVFSEPDIVMDYFSCHGTMKMSNNCTRGKVALDFFHKKQPGVYPWFNEVNIVRSLNDEKFWKMLDSFVLQ